MTNTRAILSLAALLVLSGCHAKEDITESTSGKPLEPSSFAKDKPAAMGATSAKNQPPNAGTPATAANPPSSHPTATVTTPTTATATPPRVATQGDEWKPSKADPHRIAKDADAMIRSLSGVTATIQYALQTETMKGTGNLTERIKNSTVYALEFPIFLHTKRYNLEPITARAVADGKKVTLLVNDDRRTKPVGAKAPSPQPGELIEKWPLLATREVFAGFLDGRSPFTEYVSALTRKDSGYEVSVEERTVPFGEKKLHQYRISAEIPKQQAKKLGTGSVSLIIDADIHLPVTFSVSQMKPGQTKATILEWDGKWQNHATFEPRSFVPPPAPTKA